MSEKTALVKKSISPVKVTVELEFSQINENGTFSRVSLIDGPEWLHLSVPYTGGGACYFKLEQSMMDAAGMKKAGIEMEKESSKKAPAKARKLF